MNLYLLTQTVNTGWDTYDSCVVAAETEVDAKYIHPSDYKNDPDENWWEEESNWYDDWASPNKITITLIGLAVEGTNQGIICSSFNAG